MITLLYLHPPSLQQTLVIYAVVAVFVLLFYVGLSVYERRQKKRRVTTATTNGDGQDRAARVSDAT